MKQIVTTISFAVAAFCGSNRAEMGTPLVEDGQAKTLRAIAFNLSDGQKPPDGVLPGALIDVIRPGSKPSETRVVLQAVKVLAVNFCGTGDGQGRWIVTIGVSQFDGTMLARLMEDGVKVYARLHTPKKEKK